MSEQSNRTEREVARENSIFTVPVYPEKASVFC
jgi:hypothetical protein